MMDGLYPTTNGPRPVPIPWKPGALDDFWAFVRERHEIFRRRFDQELPPSKWTEDKILRGGSFCNIYRELDRGSRHLIVHILGREAAPIDTLWNVFVYRYFNWIETYEALGGFQSAAQWNPAAAVETLLARFASGQRVFTNAYMVNYTLLPDERYLAAYPTEGRKIRLVIHRLTAAHRRLADLYAQLRGAGRMVTAHGVLTQLPGIAAFNAFQLLVDLSYPEGILTYPDVREFATFGRNTGTEKGLKELGLHWLDGHRALRALREEQPYIPGPVLTGANLANCLCEYSKYCRLRRREPAKVRHYTAKPIDRVLWTRELIGRYSYRRQAYDPRPEEPAA